MKVSSVVKLLVVVAGIMFLIYSSLNLLFGVGTHGSIKSYNYAVKKDVLHAAVKRVIAYNEKIHRDTNYGSYYNDDERYITISIITQEESMRYTFQYVGSDEDMDTCLTSEISIAYGYDEHAGRGGSEGNGDVTWYTPFLKRRITRLFEKEFIDKVDQDLGMKRTE